MNIISDKVINTIKDNISEIPEFFCYSDLALFKLRQFVERENRFDLYHFVVPKVEVPGFFVENREINLAKGAILPTNPCQKLRLSPTSKMYTKSNDVKFFCLFIEPKNFRK